MMQPSRFSGSAADAGDRGALIGFREQQELTAGKSA